MFERAEAGEDLLQGIRCRMPCGKTRATEPFPIASARKTLAIAWKCIMALQPGFCCKLPDLNGATVCTKRVLVVFKFFYVLTP